VSRCECKFTKILRLYPQLPDDFILAVGPPVEVGIVHLPRSSNQLKKARPKKGVAARNGAELSTEEGLVARDLARAFERLKESKGTRGHKGQLAQLGGWFEIALNNMARGLSMFDAEQRLLVCNRLYREIFDLPKRLTRPGTPLAEIIRYHVRKETGSDTAKDRENQRKWIEYHVAALARGETFSDTRHLKNGRIILVTNQPMPGGGWVDLQEDITEKCKAEEKITWLARHDTLTGIANRFQFREHLDTWFRELPPGAGFALHWIDLDHFKEVNDTLGHPVGDALLKSVAKRLRNALRGPDLVARMGGDEFAVLQATATRKAQATKLAKRLIRAFAEPHHVLGHKVLAAASIGIALAPSQGRNADELLKNADIALYRAKACGRGCYAFFEPEQDQEMPPRRGLEADLRGALEKGQLELYYQPIVELGREEVMGFEALMRWHHPERGLISPDDFIPLAEQMGLIVDIGAWALHCACHEAMSWPEHVKVTDNLSPTQFESGDLYETVAHALSKSGLNPSRLELEITEGLLLRDEAGTHELLHKLRNLGVKIALDDFGTAYASLSYLRSFPFDKIKIDRSFIRDLSMQKQHDCVAIIHAVAGLAKRMQMSTVAEGVETLAHLNTVTLAGCEEVQGFYFSQPVPATEVKAVLAQCRAIFCDGKKKRETSWFKALE
jgi:diguanylate cyclase (GGDEF)-like protein